jgi:hypothetical protein
LWTRHEVPRSSFSDDSHRRSKSPLHETLKQPARIFLRLIRAIRFGFAQDGSGQVPAFLHLDIRRIQLDEDGIAAEFRRHVADSSAS